MFFDMQEASFEGGVVVFPDFAFASQPIVPSIAEEVGGDSGTSISITGSLGQPG